MRSDFDNFDLEPADGERGFRRWLSGLALLALAVGAGSALLFAPAEGARTRQVVGAGSATPRGGAEGALERVQRELGRREARRRRERRTSALIGLAVGAGLAALLRRRAARDASADLDTLGARTDEAEKPSGSCASRSRIQR